MVAVGESLRCKTGLDRPSFYKTHIAPDASRQGHESNGTDLMAPDKVQPLYRFSHPTSHPSSPPSSPPTSHRSSGVVRRGPGPVFRSLALFLPFPPPLFLLTRLFLTLLPFGAGRRSLPRPLALAGVVLLFGLSACTGRPEGVSPVSPFDIARYQGSWVEIMRLDHRFERGLSHVTAHYEPREDGRITVINQGFDSRACRWKVAEGIARFQGSPDVASLSVTFFWPFAGGYHVIALDREAYGWALVSGPSRRYLWILARDPALDPALRTQLVEKARGLGFPVEELILVEHGPIRCADGSPPPPRPDQGPRKPG